MRNRSRPAVTLCLWLLLGACAAGPHQLRRSVDDLDHKLYVNSPIWNGLLWFVPVIPVCTAGAALLDLLITDPWCFWFEDLWDGAGTGFEHLHVEWTDGKVDSLLIDRSGWTRIAK